MVTLARIALRLIEDALSGVVLLLRSTVAVRAREPVPASSACAVHRARHAAAAIVDAAVRISLALLARLFDWRSALVAVQPATLIRWHRAGWRFVTEVATRPTTDSEELRTLIRRMARENPSMGEERIANELLLKLGHSGFTKNRAQVHAEAPPGQPRGDQRWSTF
jgi:hypothetical protein